MISSIFGEVIKDNFMKSIYDLLLWIDSSIYSFVSKLFNLFIDLVGATIFKTEVIENFANKIYAFIGIIALFVVTYNLLIAIVNPDKFQKNGLDIIKKVVTSLIMIVLLPSIFNFANKVQNVIIEDAIIAKIFLGGQDKVTATVEVADDMGNIETVEKEYDITSDVLMKNSGAEMSWIVLNAFLYVDQDALYDEDGNAKYKSADHITTEYSPAGKFVTLARTFKWFSCGKVLIVAGVNVATKFIPLGGIDDGVAAFMAAIATKDLKVSTVKCIGALLVEFGSETAYVLTNDEVSWGATRLFASMGEFDLLTAWSDKIVSGEIVYIPIVSTICGLILLYLIFSFCLDLGIRAVKLAFYQLIAPIPIMLRMLPNNDKAFSNWIKVTTTTYLEVFVRLIIIYVVVFFASHVGDIDIGGANSLAKAIVVLGLVTFARQLPKLLADITGIDSGNMKIGIMEKLGAGGALAAGALLGGAIMGGLKNGVNSWKNSRGQHWSKRVASTAKGGFSGAASGGFRGAKNAGFKAKNFGDTWKAATTGATDAYKKSQAKQKYKASHPGFAGVARGKISDAWNEFIYDDELKEYNDRIKNVQEFDIQKKVSDWVTSHDAATKDADAALKNFESRKLSEAEIIENERKRLENLINDQRISKGDRDKYRDALNKININDAATLEGIKNSYMAKYWSEHEKLRKERNSIRDKAIERYANTTGSEIQEMIIEANKLRNANKNDALFNNTKNIDFTNVVKDLNDNHNNIAGHDKVERDQFGRITKTEHDITGTVEQMRGSNEYRRAFERYREKIEKEGKN